MSDPRCIVLDGAALARWPLPALDGEGDKERRGRVLVIGGSREISGAALLAGEAALRAGAGKLVLAVPESVAAAMALHVPEARVIPVAETSGGGLDPHSLEAVLECGESSDAVLVGPGMMDEAAVCAIMKALSQRVGCPMVLDALALQAVATCDFKAPVVMTPHAGEMAKLTGLEKAAVLADPVAVAKDGAKRWRATVVLKGATTCIASGESAWLHEANLPGLGTSGSGDVLAGLIAGFAARGASPEQAAAWGVVLHAGAGR
ncbi:MAG: NAD(P)H-hydrate dehydratase, partial [Burkholderiaceae bacterium]